MSAAFVSMSIGVPSVFVAEESVNMYFTSSTFSTRLLPSLPTVAVVAMVASPVSFV
ncbi:hypothetical protein [uncultured Selenomonas sp.]|uniref:hypothetical protein n=1 Tax=uncultured Selenomonas sp. TaxID=159275 RepID=UPI0025FD8702|nr:hypothetical protein [uncultured Selenomonas sp.]